MTENNENRTEGQPAPLNLDPETFKKHLREQVRAAGGTKAFLAGQDFLKNLVKMGTEALLQLEMEEHLGYAKHDPEGQGSGNSRNGLSAKTIRGDFGEVEIQTPRDRNASFEPQLVKKRQTNVDNFSEKVVSLYARGMSTREIEDHLRQMYQVDISPQFISRATEKMQSEVTEWQNRPLERVYPVVYVDGLRVPVRSAENGPVLKKCVYIVLGVGCAGRQEVLGLWVEETEGARFWLRVFNDLKARGVADILILCGDGLKGLPEAVANVYPQADVQLCVVHQIRNATKFVSFKDRKPFCRDMRPIYTAPTVEAAEAALREFAAKWEVRYPMSIASWKNNWELLTAFFKYPVELRKIVYTTNAIENLNAQLRKNTANRKVFPNDDAVIKLLYLNIVNFSNRWTKRQGWDIVMNQLAVIFGERLAPNLTDHD
ncbi:MAG: IS256 family transposase [Chloroflexota bacterium]